MSVETIEPEISSDEWRLDIKTRNELQKAVMALMLEEGYDFNDELNWVLKHGKEFSDLIDHEDGQDIRDLAKAGDYEEAAKLLIERADI